MGRLIDIDVLFDYFGNDAIDEITRGNIEYFVGEKGTVEAIPKADYEKRLKADMVAMLEDIKEQLREMHEDFFETEHFDEAYGVSNSMDVIQQKINALRG